MKRTFYDRYYKDQPPWAKGVINVVVVGGAALAIYSIVSSNKKKQDIADANKPSEAAALDLKALAAKGIKPTMYDSQYYVLSDGLVQAMTGCGTDEGMVYNIFSQLRNDADILKLVIAFGVRFYQPCVWTSPISYAIWQVNDKAYGGNLATWLSYDLTDSEVSKVNSIMTANGLSYQF
jgi:hypothetical protein